MPRPGYAEGSASRTPQGMSIDSGRTFSWIHMLRPTGDPVIRGRVEAALRSGEACRCCLVQLELWNSARGQQEQRVQADLALVLTELPIGGAVSREANGLARRARRGG